jgi:hypothetical protein
MQGGQYFSWLSPFWMTSLSQLIKLLPFRLPLRQTKIFPPFRRFGKFWSKALWLASATLFAKKVKALEKYCPYCDKRLTGYEMHCGDCGFPVWLPEAEQEKLLRKCFEGEEVTSVE